MQEGKVKTFVFSGETQSSQHDLSGTREEWGGYWKQEGVPMDGVIPLWKMYWSSWKNRSE